MVTPAFNIDNYQRELFPYAYNILGIAEDAEDVVQEVMVKWQELDHTLIEHPKAYLVRSVINRAINQKEKNNRERATYIGPWLPEPIFTEDTEARLDSNKILTYSMLLLMEQLNVKERAVFILRESFDYAHADIAAALDITEELSRQLLKRAKAKIGPAPLQPKRQPTEMQRIEQFMNALLQGNAEAVEQMLAADIALASDSNGKATAARKILQGIDTVRKFLVGIFAKNDHTVFELQYVVANHQPAILYRIGGAIVRCTVFDVVDDKIRGIHFIMNPDKLSALINLDNLSRP